MDPTQQPQGQGGMPQIMDGGNPGVSSSGMNPLSGLLGNIAASQGNTSGIQGVVAQGIDQLSKLMSTNGNDAARSMLQFAQSPEGMKIMAVPGAFKELTSQFQQAVKQPALESASIPQGTTGIITRGDQTMATQQQNPQQMTEQPGTNNKYFSNGKQVSSPSQQPTTETQTFASYIKDSGLPSSVVGQIAAANAGKNDPATRSALGGTLLNMGMPKDLVNQWVSGAVSILPDPKIPGRFYTIDNVNHTASFQQLGPPTQSSLNPTYQAPGANPASFNSSPQSPGQKALQTSGQNMPAYAKPEADPMAPQTAAVAKKYNVPQEAIKADGTIDPVKAYGPSSVMALGAGLPALAQNNAGIIGRWFDPRNQDETSELVSKAEIAMGGLQFLSTGLAQGSRVSKMVEAALEMGPEHEKMNDPIYATDQLTQLRSTLEGMASVNQREITNNLNEGIAPDNANTTDMKKQNTAIEQVLSFLPSTEALGSMKQAIKDGKISSVPSVVSAGSTIAKVAGSAASHGSQALFGSGTVDDYNNDVPGTLSKIEKASPADMNDLSKVYGRLSPVLQSAFSKHLEDMRASRRGQAPAGTVKTPSGKQAVMPPPQGQSNDTYEAQPQGPSPKPKGRVGNAFSDLQL